MPDAGTIAAVSPQIAADTPASVAWNALKQDIESDNACAFDTLYATYSRGLRYLFSRRLGNEDHEASIRQVLLKTCRAIRDSEIRDPEQLPSFVRSSVNREIARITVIRRDSEHMRTRETPTRVRAQADLIGTALRASSARDREMLLRFYVRHEDLDAICRDMQITETQFRLCKSRMNAEFRKGSLPN